MADSKELSIQQGKTFALVLRWETEPIIYKAITGISQTAPARLTVTGHGAPDGWRGAVTSVKGMTQINAEANNVKAKDYHALTVVDANTVEINDINAADFKPYVSGGYLQFNTPVDLTGFTARMTIRDKVGGTALASSTDILTLTIDPAAFTIVLGISATNTAAITWKKGVYDLEMVSPTGVVTAILSGTIAVTSEVTT